MKVSATSRTCLLLVVSLFISLNLSHAQIWTIGSCSSPLGSNLYGPMYSIATANATSRTAVIYPTSQLGGISGQTLNAIYYDRFTASGTMAGTPNHKVYLKEVTADDWGAADLDWATEIATATLVYDGDPAANVGSSAGWKVFNFSTNFSYTGTQNLAVFYEYTNSTASSVITWSYEYTSPCITTTNSNTTKYSNNTTGILPATLASENFRRPLIGFDMILSCYPPSGLAVSSVGPESANLSWTESIVPPSNGYQWEVRTSGTGGSGATGLAATGNTGPGVTMDVATGLASSTLHNLFVRGFCGGTDYSPWSGPVSFTTLCAAIAPPYLQDFASYAGAAPTGLPCWSEYGDGSPPGPPNNLGTSVWLQDGFANNGTTGAAKILLSLASDRDWLVSPPFELTGGSYQMKSDFALTGSGVTTQGIFGSDDEVKVLISTDFGDSWITLETFNTGNTPPNTGVTRTYDLAAYNDLTVLFAFWGNEGTIDNPESSEFFVDNFLVEIPTACTSPTTLTATNSTQSGATLGWSEQGSATLWDLEIILSSATPTGNPTNDNVSTNPFVWTGGTAGTSYKFYVRADCGGTGVSNWVGPFTFYTLPSNDECADAIDLIPDTDLMCDASTSGTTFGSTGSAGETAPSCSATGVNDDVWYSFTATQNVHIVNISGASSITAAQLYSGSCGALVQEVCGSTSSGNLDLIVTGLTVSQQYIIRVYTTSSLSTTFSTFAICIKTPPPVTNDDCATAIPLAVNTDLNCGSSTMGSTLGATATTGELAPTCSATGINDDVWYVFNATDVSHMVTITGATNTTAAQVYAGTCGSLSTVACNSTTSGTLNLLLQNLTPGADYLVRVYSTSSVANTYSDFTICIGRPPSMSYVSSTTTHPTTIAIPAGSVNERILRVAVVVTGSNDPLVLSQLSFNTNGSTDPATDIINAKVYYTGTSTVFSTANQFGSTVNNPNGSFDVSGSQTLIGGVSNTTNYFFLAYDIPCASVPPNVVDAEGTQITIDAIYTPDITAPTGSRAISAAAYTATTAQGTTTNVFTGTTDNTVIRVLLSGCSNTTVTSIDFTTGLSTDPATDIAAAQVYFTTSTTFDNLTPFGSQVSNPNGPFTVTGSQLLVSGSGYFWLTYSIPTSATINNVVDASAESAVINSITATPTTVNPTGTRTIKAIPANDDPSGAIPITLDVACSNAPYTNEFATLGENEPLISCKGLQTSALSVWYSFVAPASGFVRISTDHATGTLDTRLAVYSAPSSSGPFTILSCDDDNGSISAAKSIVYVNDLTAGTTYYVAVDHWNGSTAGTFCLEIYEITASMLSSIGDCTAGQALSAYHQNYSGWLSLTDNSGNLRSMVRDPSGTGTGTFSYANSQHIHPGAVRHDFNQTYYLDRNYFISNASASNIDVQLFFSDTDFNDLQNADPSIITLNDLDVTKTGQTSCVLNFTSNSPVLLNQTGNGSASAISWIQFNTPTFGNFFIHSSQAALPIKLLSFDGIAMKDFNKVMWFTENEINFDQFEVQRASSTTGQFAAIGTVKSGQRSGGNYFFEDKHPFSSGFYRLKMMDLDGQFTYSKVINIKRAGTTFAIRSIFPNPSADFVNVELTSPEKMEMNIRLLDLTGKEIRTMTTSLTEGEQTIQFSLEGIQPGTYFLHVLGQVSKVIRL